MAIEEKKLRSFNAMFGLTDEDEKKIEEKSGIAQLNVWELDAFQNHPFKLYEGKRLSDLIESIKEFGVIVPIVVRARDENRYEILSGHNRVNAAKLAEVETIPAVIKEDLSDDEAMLIVTETNLMQRSFSEMAHSEKAAVLKSHYEALMEKNKEKREKKAALLDEIKSLLITDDFNDIEARCPMDTEGRTRDILENVYDMSAKTITRYVKLSECIKPILEMTDEGKIAFRAGVNLAYLDAEEQELVADILVRTNCKIDIPKSELLKKQKGNLNHEAVSEILKGAKKKAGRKPVAYKIKREKLNKYFQESADEKEIENTIVEALELYFELKNKEEL